MGNCGRSHAHAVVLDRQGAEPRSIGLDDYLFRIGVVGVRQKLSYRRPRLPVNAVSNASKNPFVCPEDGVDGRLAGAAFDAGSKRGIRVASRFVRQAHRSPQLLAWGPSSAWRRGAARSRSTPASIEGPSHL